MLSALALALLSSAPVLAVVPFELHSPDVPATVARGWQDVLEHELRSNGLTVRAGPSAPGQPLKGATHLVTGSFTDITGHGGELLIATRLIAVPQALIGAAQAHGWQEHEVLLRSIFTALKVPIPPRLKQVPVDRAVLEAWGAVLVAFDANREHDARQRLDAFLKIWPAFPPALARQSALRDGGTP